MTRLRSDQILCAVCGQASEQTLVDSTNLVATPDLDLRPPEMKRSTMPFWVQYCPHCGYCAKDLSESLLGTSAVIAAGKYREQLRHREYPELANRFRCQALIEESTGHLGAAGWACVHAAWVCDDEAREPEATACRREALRIFGLVTAGGQLIIEEPGATEIFFIDLLRRMGDFAATESRLATALASEWNEPFRTLLHYEEQLVRRRDAAVHTIEEALKNHAEHE